MSQLQAQAEIEWLKEPDEGFQQAALGEKLVLLEFTAAPICLGCNRLEAVVYTQDTVRQFVTDHFVPVKINVKERPNLMQRFHAEWTPTLILFDQSATERHRITGFLPAPDLLAQLQLGLAKSRFSAGRYTEARSVFETLASQYQQTEAAPEAVYWAGVSAYKESHDRAVLEKTGARLRGEYPDSDWAKKGSVWL